MMSFRKIFGLAFVCFGCLLTAQAQPGDTMLVNNYKLKFTVPDLPAFKALGTDPSNIMRPTEIKDFSAAIAPFYSGGKAVIPQNFALEVSPGKLASKHWRLKDYKGIKKVLYNTGLSLGAIRDSTNNSSKIALGARVSFVPKKYDLIAKAKAIAPSTDKYNALMDALRRDCASEYGLPAMESDNGIFNKFLDTLNKNPEAYDGKYKTDWDSIGLYVGMIPDTSAYENGIANLYYHKNVDSIIKSLNAPWNEPRFDVAAAFVGQSPDSLVSTSQFSSFQMWATKAWKLGKGGQFLLGGNVILPRAEKSDTFHINLSLNARCYVGVNNFKGFLETQFKYQTYSSYNKSLLINLGAEFRLSNAFWVVATGGLNNYLDTPSPVNALVSSISLKYGFATNSKQ